MPWIPGEHRRGIRAVVRRTCQGCDIGRYATSSQSDTRAVYFCDDCETGRYMNVTGVSACLYCPTGTIADETASTTCRACAPGSSIATLGTVICNHCSVGSYQKVSGQTSCVSCNAGFFVPLIGQTACQACEPGFANDQEKRIYVTLVPPACIRHYTTRPRYPVSGRADRMSAGPVSVGVHGHSREPEWLLVDVRKNLIQHSSLRHRGHATLHHGRLDSFCQLHGADDSDSANLPGEPMAHTWRSAKRMCLGLALSGTALWVSGEPIRT